MAKTTLKTGAGNSEAQYIEFVENMVAKLTENAEMFPGMDPTPRDLKQALTTFKLAQADAAYRDKRLIIIKNQALAVLKRIVYHFSLYVERQARGDASIILAAGFFPSQRGKHILNPAPKPERFLVKIEAHRSGEANLKVNSWRKALLYQFEYRKKNGNTQWNRLVSSKCRVTITGLEPIHEYEFRVAYIGRNPQITYSDVRSSYVF